MYQDTEIWRYEGTAVRRWEDTKVRKYVEIPAPAVYEHPLVGLGIDE